jgi:hypothetical protein
MWYNIVDHGFIGTPIRGFIFFQNTVGGYYNEYIELTEHSAFINKYETNWCTVVHQLV